MRLPYGIANFSDLRRGGYAYADKTGFIPALESAEKGRRYLVFLGPRRMGKTLLLSMLEHYYDVLAAPRFDELFGGLAIAGAPTEERSRYAVLRLEMTGMPADSGKDQLRAVFQSRLHNALTRFLVLVPSRSVPVAQVGFVVELKYLKSGAEEGEVMARLDEADGQLRRYLAEPKLEAIKPPKGWRAVSVAFVATEACWMRELGGEARKLGG